MPQVLEEALPKISHGDHCCLLFTSQQEQSRITASFLGIGLERKERCVYVGGSESIDVVRAGMKNAGIDVEKEGKKDRLIFSSSRDYLDGGHWNTEKMLGFLQSTYDAAMKDGFTALRAAGDVSWEVGPDHDFKDLVYYEALLDIFFIGKRMVGMCQYPKAKCPPKTLTGILNAHKIAAIDSEVCSNFHYMPPDLLIDKNENSREEKRMEWMTSQLLRAKRAEEERDQLQQQLLQSQKMEAFGKLAGGVAHDFNNILTAILGLSEFIINSPGADEDIKTDVREIKLAGERAAALTRQLLAFSRRQVMESRVLSMNEIVVTMEKFLRRIIGENIELKAFLDSALSNVKVDPGQLEQVVMNLAVNARDAMPNGGKLTIETGNVELGNEYLETHRDIKPGPYAMLAVSDSGTGMDAATKTRIFEPYFTTKEKGKGTGLGLSMVHGIVKQSGGNIFVYSEPGKGSTFKIYLPAVDAKSMGLAKPEVPAQTYRGSETVLLVEDEELVRKLVHRVLVDNGYTVLNAVTSQEALKFCERHNGFIHMMITDAVLPGISGRELSERVRPMRPKMKILFMSGYTDNVAVHHGILNEGSEFIEKPFTPERLLRRVRGVLDLKTRP